MKKLKLKKKKILNHLGKVGMAMLTFSLMISPAGAADPSKLADQVLGAEGGREATKEALNAGLKAIRSKPAMGLATTIVCVGCIPAAGAAASPGLCIACGILIAKTFG